MFSERTHNPPFFLIGKEKYIESVNKRVHKSIHAVYKGAKRPTKTEG